jgi:N-acetylglutamate synthase-like GNAT family acetyltransferase
MMAKMIESNKMEQSKSPEDMGISFREAKVGDLPLIEEFLSREEIDRLFEPKLSDPVRGITIKDRVQKKFKKGVWVIALREGKVVGCMAVVPTNLPIEVPPANPKEGIKMSEGISIKDWNVEKVMELSTVVTDPKFEKKGIGTDILAMIKGWVKRKGRGWFGLITDSWIEEKSKMDTFVAGTNRKEIQKNEIQVSVKPESFDTLIRIYSDPGKRGPEGPPTVVYGIPMSDFDWKFFDSKQDDISKLRVTYSSFANELSKPKSSKALIL